MPRTCVPWSNDEDRILMQSRRAAMQFKEIAPLIGRTIRAVAIRAIRIGSRHTSVETRWLKAFASCETDAEIAAAMDAELSTVAYMRCKLRKDGHSVPKRKPGRKPSRRNQPS